MITSTKNPRIVEARKLSQRKHRVRQNRFLVEGLQVLTMAVQQAKLSGAISRIKPLDVFYSRELFTGDTAPRLLKQLTKLGAQPMAVAPHVLDTLSERDTSQGLAATFALKEMDWSLNDLGTTIPPGGTMLLVLDKLQDPGNLGTLIRTADAAGAWPIILLEPCVDLFDPKTVRSTMGSLFNIPCGRVKDIDTLWPWLKEMGYRAVGADAARGEIAWRSNALQGPVALFLGNEARGLSPELHSHLDDYVNLPIMYKAESLNVAIAGGVLMYEWLRINTTPNG
jgi:TrmH family RNA methyltransferase